MALTDEQTNKILGTDYNPPRYFSEKDKSANFRKSWDLFLQNYKSALGDDAYRQLFKGDDTMLNQSPRKKGQYFSNPKMEQLFQEFITRDRNDDGSVIDSGFGTPKGRKYFAK